MTHATAIEKRHDAQHLRQLCDAERLIIDALMSARESIARCEQALAILAELRARVAVEQASNRTIDWHCAQALPSHNRHDDGCHALHPANRLTPREVEVLQLIAAGYSNRRIADALFLSPRTVERHIANIYIKIDVHTKAEATAWALIQGRGDDPRSAVDDLPSLGKLRMANT